jgi:hypothetical protein
LDRGQGNTAETESPEEGIMKVRQVTCSNGRTEYHAESCNHTNLYADDVYMMHFNANNMKELLHEIELEFNKDFASSDGMTPEEYVESGQGYIASFEKDSDLRVFRCIKF